MTSRPKKIINKWKTDYRFSTLFTGSVSLGTGFAFALLNGFIGLNYHTPWNTAIGIYYVLLVMIRAMVFWMRKKQKTWYWLVNLLLLLSNVALIAPIALMVRGERQYTYGLIPAIAMAAYTFYRITLCILHLRKSRKESQWIREMRIINFHDALVAMLTLQNALVIATGGNMADKAEMTSWTSFGIWIVLVVSAFLSLITMRKKK